MRHFFLHRPVTTRLWGSILLGAACIVLLAACGSTTTGSGGAYGSSGTTPTAVPPTATSASSGGIYGGGGTTPTATTASSGSLVNTATASVSGKSETILTNAQGLTLYYRTSDVPPSTVCSGGCASAWPPLLSSSAPTSSGSLSGKLTVITDTNGSQVEYNGHLLYTYAADTAPGQTTGQGVGGVWFVATPSLT